MPGFHLFFFFNFFILFFFFIFVLSFFLQLPTTTTSTHSLYVNLHASPCFMLQHQQPSSIQPSNKNLHPFTNHPSNHQFLLTLSSPLLSSLPSWRSFNAERREVASTGFIDGDLIESVLDLGKKQLQEVVSGLMVRSGLVRNVVLF